MPQGKTANSTTHQIRKKIASAVATGISGLFEFDQRAGKVLGMEKQHRLAMRPDLWLAAAAHPSAARFERIARPADILNPAAYAMNAAIRTTPSTLPDLPRTPPPLP